MWYYYFEATKRDVEIQEQGARNADAIGIGRITPVRSLDET
jgi:hypothetical protein